jgi:Flp pilus assembly pilin Flp
MQSRSPWFKRVAAHARRLRHDEVGATAIEYGLLVAGIGLAVSVAVFSIGENIKVVLYERLIAMFAS